MQTGPFLLAATERKITGNMEEKICKECGHLFEIYHIYAPSYCLDCSPKDGPFWKIVRQKQAANGLYSCSKCKEYKPANEFYNSKHGKFGKHHYCKICHRGSHDPVSTKQYHKERAYRLKLHYVKEAGDKCQRCGYNEFIAALDFHHINRDEKEYHPQKVINNGNHEMAQAELDKCILLCANCHRGYEGGFWKADFAKRDGLGWTIKQGSVVKTNYDEAGQLSEKHRYSQMSLV